jgi:folate-binding protein YgfZ
VYSFLLNAKGRILADMNVLERGDHTLLDVDVRLVTTLEAEFKRYQFGEQVKFESLVGRMHALALYGPTSLAILNEIAEPALGELTPLGSAETRVFGIPVVVWRDDPCGVPGHHLIVDSTQAVELWTALSRQGESGDAPGKRRLHRAGWAAFNATRVEAGRPVFDIDFGNSADPEKSVVPAETGQMDRAVSLNKGCYVGQEIVARMHARQQVSRLLVGLRFEDDHLPIAGAGVQDDQSNVVGVVTSSTVSPMLSGKAIALAMVKKPHFAPGAVLHVPAEGAMRRATVVTPPFIR